MALLVSLALSLVIAVAASPEGGLLIWLCALIVAGTYRLLTLDMRGVTTTSSRLLRREKDAQAVV